MGKYEATQYLIKEHGKTEKEVVKYMRSLAHI